MSDRWNPKWVTRPVERPVKIVVPDGAPPASSSVEPRGKTWGIRRRGDLEGQVKHAYRCPVHGEFEAMVPRSDVPDEVVCGSITGIFCGRTATWAGSSCGIGHAAGEVMS